MKIISVFLPFLWFLVSCKTPPAAVTRQYLNDRVNKPYDATEVLPVLFATNRKRKDGIPKCSDNFYSTRFSEDITYATCEVNVPSGHTIGNLDYSETGSSDKFFKFSRHSRPISEDALLAKIRKNPHPEMILFVHGFNVKFEEAVLRAAQIKYDLKFGGEMVLFSWPAGSSGGFFNSFRIDNTYTDNQKNAQKTIPIVRRFINKLSSTNKKMHIIVHSMGHQLVLPAISELGKSKAKFIQELILNAPDFPSEDFYRLAKSLKNSSQRITVYCSPGDKALIASKEVNENKRVGSCEKIKDVDMINVNHIDDSILGLNHGYYSSRPILTDLYQLLLGVEARKRLFVITSHKSTEDYILRR